MSEKMLIDLTPLVQVLILLLCTVVSTYVVPYIKKHADKAQQEQLAAWVHIAVYAAEKLYGAGHGAEKLDYALTVLEQNGFTVDYTTVTAMVNAAIQELEICTNQEGHAVLKMEDDAE